MTARQTLLAYCGDADARKATSPRAGCNGDLFPLGCACDYWPGHSDELDTDDHYCLDENFAVWVRGLTPLLEAPMRECVACEGGGVDQGDGCTNPDGHCVHWWDGDTPCCRCKKDGSICSVCGGSLLLKVSLAVASEAYAVFIRYHWEDTSRPCEVCESSLCGEAERRCPVIAPVREAVFATQALYDDASDENQRAVRVLANQKLCRPDWAWQPLRIAYSLDGAARSGFPVGLVSASGVIGEAIVRSTVLKAVLS